MNKQGNKVSIVGAGNVGATTAYTLILSGLVSELVLVDLSQKKAQGEVMDLRHGIPLCPPTLLRAGGYEDCVDSDIVILTAGASQKPGETRMDLLKKNIAVFEDIVPQVVKVCPDCILLVVTNPVDVLAYATQRISGFPASRVIGSGTVLDTSRLRYLLSEHTGLDARNIHTYILGEHGDTELAAWSLTTIAGMDMASYCKMCAGCANGTIGSQLNDIYNQVKNAAYEIIEAKGSTYYAVALAVKRVVEAILRDEKSILTVSSLMHGHYGLRDVYLSLPAVVGANGIERTLAVTLSEKEEAEFIASATAIRTAIDQTRFDDKYDL